MVPTRMLYISPNRGASESRQSASRSRSRSKSPIGGGGNIRDSKVTRIVQGHLMPIRDTNTGAFR